MDTWDITPFFFDSTNKHPANTLIEQLDFCKREINYMKNKVFYGEYSLKHWINLLLTGNIILPKYQRSFVWGKQNVIKLIESITDDHFIPSSKYVNYYFQSNKGKKQLSILTTGSTIKHILASDMQNFICPFPCREEQQKIADCLSSIDLLIQTQQKVVTTWQQRKKALLQQMFI
ncbi:MAG: restriction endonuclease subunit S [Treponema sp.]|nr:restriction endonuclease subunit S [Treponema sp.]MEE3436148.1 restriction endonuclease subunit S [Treponema sp.]